MIDTQKVKEYFLQLQSRIVERMEQADGKKFILIHGSGQKAGVVSAA